MAAKRKTVAATRKRTRRRSVNPSGATPEHPPEPPQSVKRRVAKDKVAFIERLRARLGILMHAAEDVNKSRRTIELWRKADPVFDERVQDCLAKQRAIVETKLMEKVLAGDMQAIKFYLRCKGRERDVPDAWREIYQQVGGGDVEGSPNTTQSQVSISKQRDRVNDGALASSLAAAMKVAPHLFEGLEVSAS